MKYLLYASLVLIVLSACESNTPPAENQETAEVVVEPNLPEWHKNATIYEVNLRHYTPEGTFNAFAAHLPRLKNMGIDILWLMPIHPISEAKRKGELGSPYAVADYKDVNLKAMKSIQKDFKVDIGYSDHTLGDVAPIVGRAAPQIRSRSLCRNSVAHRLLAAPPLCAQWAT